MSRLSTMLEEQEQLFILQSTVQQKKLSTDLR